MPDRLQFFKGTALAEAMLAMDQGTRVEERMKPLIDLVRNDDPPSLLKGILWVPRCAWLRGSGRRGSAGQKEEHAG